MNDFGKRVAFRDDNGEGKTSPPPGEYCHPITSVVFAKTEHHWTRGQTIRKSTINIDHLEVRRKALNGAGIVEQNDSFSPEQISTHIIVGDPPLPSLHREVWRPIRYERCAENEGSHARQEDDTIPLHFSNEYIILNLMQDQQHNAQYYLNLGNVFRTRGMLDEAISCYEKSLALAQHPTTLNNLGNALRDKGNYTDALRYYKLALQIDPDFTSAELNSCMIHLEMGEFEKAESGLRALLLVRPYSAEIHNCLGIVLREIARFHEALESFKRAIDCDANLEHAHQNLSALYLLMGNFEKGWREYRWFWNLRGPYDHLQKPLWDGFDIRGNTLLLHAGAGFGDTFQFIRYTPLIKERGASVLVGCRREIASLLKGVDAIDGILVEGATIPHFDVQSSLFRLPIIFETTIDSIPTNIPYITVDKELIDAWNRRIGQWRDSFRIGLAWAGGHRIGTYRFRAFPPRLFSHLLRMGNAVFYSLQVGSLQGIEEIKASLHIIDFTKEIRDFADTAALIQNLDLVISIDTAVAHLAGALGKPVWTLLPFVPDWRWLLDRDDSPWYPTMRLFRQPSPGDWTSVIARVNAELQKWVSEK